MLFDNTVLSKLDVTIRGYGGTGSPQAKTLTLQVYRPQLLTESL